MNITETTSATPQTCFRCTAIGLPPNGIPAGQKHLLIVSSAKTDTACMDCYNRMVAEMSASNDRDGIDGQWQEGREL